jgi:hypothetical protein
MERTIYAGRLEKAKTLPEIFEVVKDAVQARTGLSRGGLMLGLAELGGSDGHFIGGLYPVATNVIVMNKGPMARIKASRPEIYQSYVFHILLHEYLHAIGYMDEDLTRKKALEISEALFGEKHPTTAIARDLSSILPFVRYAVPQQTPEDMQIELIKGFDAGSFNNYIY